MAKSRLKTELFTHDSNFTILWILMYYNIGSSSSEEENGSLTRKAFLIKSKLFIWYLLGNAPEIPLPAFTKTATERACVNRREQRQNFFISKLVRHNGTVSKRKDSSKRRLDKLSISSSDSNEDENPFGQEYNIFSYFHRPSNETAQINLSLGKEIGVIISV